MNSPQPNTGILDPVTFIDPTGIYSQVELQIEAAAEEFGGAGSFVGTIEGMGPSVLLGDINRDGGINLLDVAPFLDLLINGGYQPEADMNG